MALSTSQRQALVSPGVLPMAAPDAVALLRVVFRRRAGVTFLAEQRGQAPWRVVRPFQLPDGAALLQLAHVGPGIMAGDRYRLEIVVEDGAAVVLIGASASKVHTMPPGLHACQSVTFTVGEGASLEYYPGLCIPFPSADISQRVSVDLAASARFAMLDTWAAGRVERGERGAFRRISTRTRIAVDGRPVYRDALELSPESPGIDGHGALEGFQYVLSGIWRPTEDRQAREVSGPGLLMAEGPVEQGRYARALALRGIDLITLGRGLIQEQRARWGLAPLSLDRFSSAFS